MKKLIIYFSFFALNLFQAHSSYISAQVINTIAGNGYDAGTGLGGYTGDGGPATDAELNGPNGIKTDKMGNIYFAEAGNGIVRKVTSPGIISTVAGNGITGYSGDSGQATAAELSEPQNLALDDSGNIYIADAGNNVIRKVSSSGIITTVAGNGGKWYSGDGGPATAAQLDLPSAVALDNSGNIYISDGLNNVIRKIKKSTGIITTVAGSGYGWWQGAGTGKCGYNGDSLPARKAELCGPNGLAFDTLGNLYIADAGNNVIRKLDTVRGIITNAAGNGYGAGGLNFGGYNGDGGPAMAAELGQPIDVSFDKNGNMYISEAYNDVVRKVMTTHIIITVAGHYSYRFGFSGDGGPATNAELNQPSGVAFDQHQNFYIADIGNNRIRKVDSTIIFYSGNSGIEQLDALENGAMVFPNPNNGIFTIQSSVVSGQWSVEVYSVLGEKIMSAELKAQSEKFDLSGEPNGIYFYRVVQTGGEDVGSGKFVIQH